MRTRSIEGLPIPASVLCLGALPFTVTAPDPDVFAILDRFVEGGGNFLDTALVYGEWLPVGNGASERVIGRWMKSRTNREHLVIGTKGGHPAIASMDVPRLTASHITSDIEQSLDNLQVDHIDLYWLHRDDPLQPVERLLGVLDEQVRRGTISAYGCSNWSLPRIREAQQASKSMGVAGFVANQAAWNLAMPGNEKVADRNPSDIGSELVDFHRSTQMPLATYASLASGFFNKLASSGTDGLASSLRDRYDNPTNRSLLTRIERAASRLGTSLSAVQIAALTTQPFPVFAIVGVSSMRQLDEALTGGAPALATEQALDILADLEWPAMSN